MSGQRLGRDVFLALAAVGWSDGKLHPEEADAIVRTALEEGLELDEISEIEEATKQPVEFDSIDWHAMTKADRLFVYAVAAYMTRVDGKVDPRESEALDRLGKLLAIPPRPREHADAIAREVAELGGADETFRYDFGKLRETIGARLAEAQRLRAAAGEPE
jgi:uncharacterized membrane protein YebE (DUF533 family)